MEDVYNTLIRSYLTTGQYKTSLALFNHMLANQVQPINLTFPSLIKAACSSYSVSYGVALHGQALNRGVIWHPSVLEALLGACKIHEDVELDNKVGKWLIGLQPQHCGQYVALSTLNAMKSNWAEAEQMRKVIIKAGIRKIPAQSVLCFKA